MILNWREIFEKNSIFLMCWLMCKWFIFLNFSSNISYRFSIVKYDFWCFDVDYEINKQINNTFFTIFDIRFDVKIEKRNNFDATTERKTISVQNICFFDVANEISKNEKFEIVFDEITNNIDINVDLFFVLFRDKKIANDVDNTIDTIEIRFAIIVFDVKKILTLQLLILILILRFRLK